MFPIGFIFFYSAFRNLELGARVHGMESTTTSILSMFALADSRTNTIQVGRQEIATFSSDSKATKSMFQVSLC